MLKIHQMRHEAHFTILANQAIRDGRLSGLARSILFELLSRPPGWQSNADRMWRQARKDRGERAEGRRAFRAAFAELEEFGYLVRDLGRNGNRVETVMHLYHLPQEGSGKGSRNPSGNGSSNGVTEESADQQAGEDDGSTWGAGSGTSQSGTSESGTSETGTSLRSTDHGSTDVGSTEDEESSALADARAGQLASSLTREGSTHEPSNEEPTPPNPFTRYTLTGPTDADFVRPKCNTVGCQEYEGREGYRTIAHFDGTDFTRVPCPRCGERKKAAA